MAAFVWGDNGAQVTPEDVSARRKLAMALREKGMDTSPVGHWTQGLARVISALAGNMQEGYANEEAAKGRETDSKLVAALLGQSSDATEPAKASVGTMPTQSGYVDPKVASLGPNASSLSSGQDDVYNTRVPAAIRTNNPGAQWMGPTAMAYGATGKQTLNDGLGRGNNIAMFPAPENGAAAMFALLNKNYAGMPLGDAIRKWSGGNSSDAYIASVAQATGLSPNEPIGPNILANPQVAIGLGKAMARYEAGRDYPMSDEQWQAAHDMFVKSAQGGGALAARPPIWKNAPDGQEGPPIGTMAPQPGQIATAPMPQAPDGSTPGAPQPQRMPPQAPPQQAQAPSSSRLNAAIQAMSNPWASPGTKAVAQAIIASQIKENDPLKALQIQKLQQDLAGGPLDQEAKRVGIEKTRQDMANAGKTGDIRDYEYAKANGFQGSFQDYVLQTKKAGASSVNIDQKAEGQFEKDVGTAQAKLFTGMAEDAVAARMQRGQIGNLRQQLAQTPGGAIGGLQGLANQWGIKLGPNASAVEAAQATISQLVPAQRQGMPGAASDRDVAMFREALPKLGNTPEGNALILDTMDALAAYREAQGQIATQVITGQMSRQDGMKALQSLPDPFAKFKAAAGQGGGAPASQQTQPAQAPAPDADGWVTLPGGVRIREKR